jgi:hypothetical protein
MLAAPRALNIYVLGETRQRCRSNERGRHALVPRALGTFLISCQLVGLGKIKGGHDMATVMGMNVSNKFMSKPIPLVNAVPELKRLGIGFLKLFDWDAVNRDFAKSVNQSNPPIQVALGIPNYILTRLSTPEGAQSLLDDVVKACSHGPYPDTLLFNVRWICVGNEPLLRGYNDQYLSVLSKAVNNLYGVLQKSIKGLRGIEWAILELKTREERGLQGDSAF